MGDVLLARFNFKVRENRHELEEVTVVPLRTAAGGARRIVPQWVTEEGAPGFVRTPRLELYLLAVSYMVGEDAFYERAGSRHERFRELVRTVAVTDADWFARFVPWLRLGAMLRSASVVAALEGAYAQVQAGVPGSRALVDAALQRADEPGEALAYWLSRHGRTIPKPVKRGVADAVRRLYTEKNLLKYDSAGAAVRFGDVVRLTHPVAVAPWQGDLFRHAVDRCLGRDRGVPDTLPVVRARAELMATPVEQRRAVTDPAVLARAGMTWEALAGWRQSTMDAAAWTSMIPNMGYFALLRNLRNFDEAGVGDDTAAVVAARLSDPAEVARARVLPMRFLSAYRAAPSPRWAEPLASALQHALVNVPALDGRVLILIDTSGSMSMPFSKDGSLRFWDAAAVFGLAVAARAAEPTVVSFSTGSRAFPEVAGESLLAGLDRFKAGYFLAQGTETRAAVQRHYDGHDRVVILTDEQASWHGDRNVAASVPGRVPVYTWNLAGYRLGHAPSAAHRHTFGGLSDAAFRMIPLVEAGDSDCWPF
ncbi:TROVE domain-containing protein [Catellatospora sp. IY07-71]|uniref:TROVE domain-containing protein n=1 Tax=Catellatospora sp. IY07-71 TaxID=2728827 RepID=UPI001BB35D7C|nr:TROVE domain-containing protein [Catellatospora sp. IY07-71]